MVQTHPHVEPDEGEQSNGKEFESHWQAGSQQGVQDSDVDGGG